MTELETLKMLLEKIKEAEKLVCGDAHTQRFKSLIVDIRRKAFLEKGSAPFQRCMSTTLLDLKFETDEEPIAVDWASRLNRIHEAIESTINERRYFVVVFGDPDREPDRDPVESGVYKAGETYPAFDALPGDMLLLYCTDEYTEHRMEVPGIGKVLRADRVKIEYEYRLLPKSIMREAILQKFEPEHRKMMFELGITTRRVFQISKQSFSNVVGDQMLADLSI